jgi:pimeloyl-ACP methyl ester carboxylesterase
MVETDAVRLPGGRHLALTECGNPDGHPVLFCHGFPGSGTMGRLLAESAANLGVRILAPDRPGHGRSPYQIRRRIHDWPGDVAALVVALELEEFAVLGRGAGAPYALACAHDLEERLTATGVVSPVPPPSVVRRSLGPLARLRYDVTRWFPFGYLPRVRGLANRLAGDPDAVERDQLSSGPRRDRTVASDRRVRERHRTARREAFGQGVLGPLRDATLRDRGWGFRLEGITRDVHLWHGRRDPVVPVARAERVAERIPDCTATFYEDGGHVSVLVDHAREILDALVT